MERSLRLRQLHLLLFARKPDDKIIFLKGRSSGFAQLNYLPISYGNSGCQLSFQTSVRGRGAFTATGIAPEFHRTSPDSKGLSAIYDEIQGAALDADRPECNTVSVGTSTRSCSAGAAVAD